jgi:hypothetical protein
VSIIENHQPRYTSTSMVESYPVKTPMLDIVTVVIHGTIRAAELEIEAAVERTSRSPSAR